MISNVRIGEVGAVSLKMKRKNSPAEMKRKMIELLTTHAHTHSLSFFTMFKKRVFVFCEVQLSIFVENLINLKLF
jgi:hypothetical protein